MAEVPILAFGLDHHRTPLALRERLALSGERVAAVVAGMRGKGAAEVVVLSTCNRLECYVAGLATAQPAVAVLAEHCGVDPTQVLDHAYSHTNGAGVRHLFRVVSGLESLVLGEEQIVAQVRGAYETALAAGWTGSRLNPLFQRALSVAKEVRTSTALSRHKLSVASVAVDLARQVQGDLARARLLVLGAGEMAELAVRYLIDHGVSRITVVNRSQERALELASAAGAEIEVRPWSALSASLADHDIVVASTAAPHAVVSVGDVRSAMARRRSPLVFIDLAVPRDIEPAVSELDDVYLYNIDHLDQVVAANRQLRREEVDAAEAVVEGQVQAYLALSGSDINRLLSEVARLFHDVVQSESDRLIDRLALPEGKPREEARYAIERATGKLTHRIHAYLRKHPGDAAAEQAVRDMLGL